MLYTSSVERVAGVLLDMLINTIAVCRKVET